MGVAHEIRREPHGVVLVLAPSNYPFFLPAVQVLQALAAGNAVLVKPGENGAEAAFEIQARFCGAGFPQGLIQILGESPEHGAEAIELGVDKIVLTGSARTGAAVLAQAAETLTPCTMELSGNDAVFVMDDADAVLAAECVAYGVRLYGGRTCIAPRRVFVWESRVGDFRRELMRAGGKDVRVVNDLDSDGAFGEPFVSVIPVPGPAEALRQYQNSDHRLGASIFARDLAKARQFAETLDAGSVCINDLIVPTADGRLPFGGRKRSGFGVTRGAEGLLEMTVTKTISVRAGKFRPHLNAKQAEDATALSGVARLIYGGWAAKWQALAELCQRRKL
jgi:acyl-CoA reductase-like NAD-dependent aldehyde dehydrogenase